MHMQVIYKCSTTSYKIAERRLLVAAAWADSSDCTFEVRYGLGRVLSHGSMINMSEGEDLFLS